MKNILTAIIKDFEAVISGFFLLVTVSVVVINVILRYLFQGGFFWVEEVATTCFIWSIFIGAAGAYRYKMHIGIDLITRLFPESIKELISIIVNAVMVFVNSYVVYLSILFIQQNRLKMTPVLALPALYVNLAITIGFSLMTIHALIFLGKELKLYLFEDAAPEGGK